jgi:hypothetical protein
MKGFETCPKQYYHVTVRKEFPFQETDATRYGTEFHKAAEEYIRDDTPVPERFSFAVPTLEALKAKPGAKHCELKMGLTEDLQPCKFFDKDVWFRGIVDGLQDREIGPLCGHGTAAAYGLVLVCALPRGEARQGRSVICRGG